mgnify:CR=1 FL=1
MTLLKMKKLVFGLGLVVCFACNNKKEAGYDYARVKQICDSAVTLMDKYLDFNGDGRQEMAINFDEMQADTGNSPTAKTGYDYLADSRQLLNKTLEKINNDSLRLFVLSTKMKSYLVLLMPDPEKIEDIVKSIEDYLALSKKIESDKYNILTEGEKKRLQKTYEQDYIGILKYSIAMEKNPDSVAKAFEEEKAFYFSQQVQHFFYTSPD